MKLLKDFFYSAYDYLVGWFEVSSARSAEYKYVIEDIELKQEKNKLYTVIHYKMVGVRTLRHEMVSELNTSHVFSLFKPEHAQIIVSIATVESLINKSQEEILNKYRSYVLHCSMKIGEKNRL